MTDMLSNYNADPPKLLIVDDDPASTFLTEEILLDHLGDISIITFNSAPDCLDFLSREKGEMIIFLDINMPGMNGWEFLRRFKEIGYEHKVVMLTSSINDDDMHKASDEQVEFMNKPLDPSLMGNIGKAKTV